MSALKKGLKDISISKNLPYVNLGGNTLVGQMYEDTPVQILNNSYKEKFLLYSMDHPTLATVS